MDEKKYELETLMDKKQQSIELEPQGNHASRMFGFEFQFSSNLAPKTARNPPNIALKAHTTAQGTPRTAPERFSRNLQDRSGTLPERLRTIFKILFGRCWMCAGTILR